MVTPLLSSHSIGRRGTVHLVDVPGRGVGRGRGVQVRVRVPLACALAVPKLERALVAGLGGVHRGCGCRRGWRDGKRRAVGLLVGAGETALGRLVDDALIGHLAVWTLIRGGGLPQGRDIRNRAALRLIWCDAAGVTRSLCSGICWIPNSLYHGVASLWARLLIQVASDGWVAFERCQCCLRGGDDVGIGPLGVVGWARVLLILCNSRTFRAVLSVSVRQAI